MKRRGKRGKQFNLERIFYGRLPCAIYVSYILCSDNNAGRSYRLIILECLIPLSSTSNISDCQHPLVYRQKISPAMPLNSKAVYPDIDRAFVPFPSRRSVVHSTNGIVSCTQPLAAAAGQRVLREGGNAADAAVAVGKLTLHDIIVFFFFFISITIS